MTHARGPLALVVVLGLAADAPAQLAVGFGPSGLGFYGTGRTWGWGGHARRLWLSGYLSAGYAGGFYSPFYSPFGAYPYGQTTIILSSPPQPTTPLVINQPITIVNNPPAEAPPDDDVVVVRPRRALLADRREQERKGIFAPEPEEIAPPEEPPLPGERRGVFRPVGPDDRARALQPMPERLPPPAVRPARETAEEETARHIAQGKDAFAAQQYGLAARRLRQATASGPKDALAHFLLAQAQFALGKYAEAVASIQAGLRLRPDWPTAGFRPAELYGPQADDFKEQMQFLRDAVAAFPRDPVLPFLLGYELWFDGRREEAVAMFRRAAAVTPNDTFINDFLRVQ